MREMQIKTMLRYDYTPAGTAETKHSDKRASADRNAKKRTLPHTAAEMENGTATLKNGL